MDPRLSIITLGVSDLERSTIFYRDGLGLPRSDASNDRISFFRTGNTWLALFPREALAKDACVSPAGSGFPRFTIAHNLETRADVHRVLSEAESAGGRIVKPAQETTWGGYSGYFADPDGFLWEVACEVPFQIE
jgi:catechol 2,3-dioxygenase-like lactoylglutathione lyase family enzyme